MVDQLSLFDFGKETFRIKKRIRLIELFGGIGAQSKAIELLGADFENWRYVEWCYKSIASYKAIHFPEDHKDYSEGMSAHDVRKFIYDSGVSDDWNRPMGERKAMALPEMKARMIFNDIKASRCIPDITKAKASDFGISENGYCYIMTYSFPCQDLSLAGKRKGMAKGSGTRSGMLWEVERILREMKQSGKVPEVLVMENVPQVTKDSVSWNDWLQFLESIGYTNIGGVLNAKDFGIPQNRERFFLVSVLGDYAVGFPGARIAGRHCLKDFCDTKAERRFFMTEGQLKGIVSWEGKSSGAPKVLQNIEGETARPVLSSEWERGSQSNYIGMPIIDSTKKGFDIGVSGDGVYTNNLKGKRGTVQHKAIQTIKTTPDIGIITDCDGISTNDSESHFRGPLKGLSRTIKTDGNQGVQIVLLNSNDEKGKERHLQDRIYSDEGISQTFNTDGGGGHVPFVSCDVNGLGVYGVGGKYLYVRRLMPIEAWRLMGFGRKDYELASESLKRFRKPSFPLSHEAWLYHEAGDSIVVTVLMAVFGELLGVKWEKKVEDYAKRLMGERG